MCVDVSESVLDDLPAGGCIFIPTSSVIVHGSVTVTIAITIVKHHYFHLHQPPPGPLACAAVAGRTENGTSTGPAGVTTLPAARRRRCIDTSLSRSTAPEPRKGPGGAGSAWRIHPVLPRIPPHSTHTGSHRGSQRCRIPAPPSSRLTASNYGTCSGGNRGWC